MSVDTLMDIDLKEISLEYNAVHSAIKLSLVCPEEVETAQRLKNRGRIFVVVSPAHFFF